MEFIRNFMRKVKILFWSLIALAIVGVVILFSLEKVQKKMFDAKADAVGTNRTIHFYTFTGEKVSSFSDKSMRFETEPYGVISVWLGSVNKKVKSNMSYIVEDN